MKTVAIIGTAGRDENKDRLTLEIYNKALAKSKEIIENTFKLDPKNIMLISGGAAWMDQISVNLFLENYVNKATLFIPCDWDFKHHNYKRTYKDGDCARAANYYHEKFTKTLGRNTLKEIEEATKKGLVLDTSTLGFKNRNSSVAQSDYIIAFTWYDSPNGGTRDTWNKAKTENKININLHELI